MNVNRKVGFMIAVSVAAIFPIIFLVIFANLKQPTIKPDTVLPIYGNKVPFERTNADGDLVIDTSYHTVPKFRLITHLGDTITESRLRGVVTVVDFFFTTCPTICIDMAKNKRVIQEHFKTDKDVQIVSFTVDPETDTQEQLFRYAHDNDVNSSVWTLVTGDKPALYRLAREGFLLNATEGDGGPHDFIHDNRFVLVDKEKRIRGFYDGTSAEETEKLIQDIEKLLVSYIIPLKEK